MRKFEMDFKKSFCRRSNVQKVDSTIHRINHYPLDSPIGFANTYPLDSDLSGGQRSPAFEQPGPGLNTGVENNIFWSEVLPARIPRAPRDCLTGKSSPGFI